MTILCLICLLILTVYAYLIRRYDQGWIRLTEFEPGGDPISGKNQISVIIPARNEEKRIAGCLRSLEDQTLPGDRFEVIVVDDFSTDATREILNQFRSDRLSFRSLFLSEESFDGPSQASGKKRAIEAGIRMARGDLIVTTDADCRFEPGWLATLSCFYLKKGDALVAGPVRLSGNRSLLSQFQTLDFICMQGITGGALSMRFHAMGNGANLSYTKKLFDEVRGFEGNERIPSGDDMFLIHKIFYKNPDKVFFLKSRQAIVTTAPEPTWKGFLNQRIRWSSKADQYQDRRLIAVLGLVYLFNGLFLVLLVAAWIRPEMAWVWLGLLLAKTLLEYPFVRRVARFYGQERLMRYFLFLQPLHIGYILLAGCLGKFGFYRWKGRQSSRWAKTS